MNHEILFPAQELAIMGRLIISITKGSMKTNKKRDKKKTSTRKNKHEEFREETYPVYHGHKLVKDFSRPKLAKIWQSSCLVGTDPPITYTISAEKIHSL